MINLYTISSEMLEKAVKPKVFGLADVKLIMDIKAWVEDYRRDHDGALPTKWLEEFTPEAFERYNGNVTPYSSAKRAEYSRLPWC